MKLATTTGDFAAYTKDQFEAIDYISEAGFKYLDYSFGVDLRRKDGVFSDDWKAYVGKLKKYVSDKGMKFVQSHAPMGQPFTGGEEFIEINKRCIEACAMLGIDCTVVHAGHLKGIATKEESFLKNKEFYDKLLPFAEEHGVYILTENFNKMFDDTWYWPDDAQTVFELVEYINHPMLKVCWDTGHGNMKDIPQHESLKILNKYVHALHVQDNWSFDDHHIAPFFGTMNLDSLMHGLQEIGYNGYFTFEAESMFMPPHRKRQFEGDTRLLRVPLEIRIKGEALLYEIGKYILTAYDCFEE